MKIRRERERERNIPYTRADPYTYQIQKILMAAFITPSPMKSILTWIVGYLFSFSVVEQFVCTEKMDLQKSAAVVFFFAFKHWVFCFVLVKFTNA